MRQYIRGITILCIALFMAGCARYPTQGGEVNAPPVSIYSEITLNGPINPAYYYFFAIDTDNDDSTGPVPVVSVSQIIDAWGTISGLGPNDPIQEPPFYVMYHGGDFQQYRNGQRLGRPFRGELQGDRKIVVEIDARDLVPAGEPLPSTIQLNWITVKELTIRPQNIGGIREYDGFGFMGNDYLAYVPLDQNRIYYNGDGTSPEEFAEDTTFTPAIDMIDWYISVRIRRAL